MSPLPKPRRTTRVTYEGHGILVARIEHERRLFRGMKDHFAFVIPDRGAWEFVYRGTTYQQGPGVLQLKQPAELYRDLRRDRASSYDVVVFEPSVVARARAATSRAADVVLDEPQLAISDPRAAALIALAARVTACRDPDRGDRALAMETAVAEAALGLVALGAHQPPAGRERRAIQRTKAYLRDRLAEPIHLDDVADHVGLDKYHLIRSFRAQVGVPPYEYLTHARIHRARSLLRAGMTAAATASAVGYYDQSQLHRHFVKLTGMTPGRYAAAAAPSSRASIVCEYHLG